MMIRPTVPGGVTVFIHWLDFPEAVQIELSDKAWEVGGFEGVGDVQVDGAWRQDLSLEEMSINDNSLALAVPEDGFICRVVHQTPQFGREVIRVDGVREWASTSIHGFICRTGNRGNANVMFVNPRQHEKTGPTVNS